MVSLTLKHQCQDISRAFPNRDCDQLFALTKRELAQYIGMIYDRRNGTGSTHNHNLRSPDLRIGQVVALRLMVAESLVTRR